MTEELKQTLATLTALDGASGFEQPVVAHLAEQFEAAIREQVQKIKTETVSKAELDRVKAQVIADDVYQRDSIFYQGMAIGIFESIGLSWKQVDDYVPAIKQITAEQGIDEGAFSHAGTAEEDEGVGPLGQIFLGFIYTLLGLGHCPD